MKYKEFTNKEEAKQFAKKHKGYVEYCVDEKANVTCIVFYK